MSGRLPPVSEKCCELTDTATTTTQPPTKVTVDFLKGRATYLMQEFCNNHSDFTFPQLLPLIHPDFTATHDDWPANKWDQFTSTLGGIIKEMPDFHCEVKDVIAEMDQQGGGRAWVFSRITGHPGGQVDSVDMMTFDKEGRIVGTKDVQRSVSEKRA